MIEVNLSNHNELYAIPWESMLTIRLNPRHSLETAYQSILKHIIRPMADFGKTQIAAVTVMVPRQPGKSQHAHCLLISKTGNELGSLADNFHRHLQEKHLKYSRNGTLHFREVDHIVNAVNYITGPENLIPGAFIRAYNTKLLNKRSF